MTRSLSTGVIHKAVDGYCNDDRAYILTLSLQLQKNDPLGELAAWRRRDETQYTRADDSSFGTGTSGRGHQSLWLPKSGVILES